MDFELEEEYKKTSGFDVGKIHDAGCVYYSDDYVKWLETKLKKLRVTDVSGSLPTDIRDEMDADMEDSGVAQGEIESCLNHWSKKYIIRKRQ